MLADAVGRKRALVLSLAVFSLAGGAIALAADFRVVLAVRLVQGTAAAGIFVTAVTLIGDAFEGVRRNAVLGVNASVLAAGAAVYPLLGGYLATVSWNAPFVAYLLGLPVAAFAWVGLEETATGAPAGALSIRNSVTFLGRAVGPVLFAGLAARTGYRPLLLAAGVAGLAGVALAPIVSRD